MNPKKPLLKQLVRGVSDPKNPINRLSPIPGTQPRVSSREVKTARPVGMRAPSQSPLTIPGSAVPRVSSAKRLNLPSNIPSAPIGHMIPPDLKPLDMMKSLKLRVPSNKMTVIKEVMRQSKGR